MHEVIQHRMNGCGFAYHPTLWRQGDQVIPGYIESLKHETVSTCLGYVRLSKTQIKKAKVKTGRGWGLGDGLEVKSIGCSYRRSGIGSHNHCISELPKLQLQGSLWPLTSVGTAHTDTMHACAPKGWEVKARLEVQG